LVKHFGEDRPIDAINAGDADEWAAALRKDYSPATIATFIKRARQMFRLAARKKMLVESPFGEIRVPSQVNKSREEFVDTALVDKLIDAAPDHDWRCIIALARYGGLRTPSETLALKWQDVDWAGNRVTVFSPKLEHLPSNGIRQIPLFPELRRILEEAFEAAPEGAVHVVGRYRDGKQNLRTQFLRIIRKAGVQPWGRLFHNLRGSRETELVQDFPVHVVAHWLGNTPKVATAHYLQIRDSDYDRASQSRAQSDARGAQNTAQQASAASCTDSQNAQETLEIIEPNCVFAGNVEETKYPRQESNL
jgi:integrase